LDIYIYIYIYIIIIIIIFVVVDTTFCHKVCLLPNVVMLESQSDELCGLRPIAVSWAIFECCPRR